MMRAAICSSVPEFNTPTVYYFSYEEEASELAKIYSAIDPARRWMTVGADSVVPARVARRTMEHVESVTKSDSVVKSVKKETNA